ncbi:DUF2851 family protein [Rhodocytophaga rosea]|uniref:DUF2851 family protein n=1 Tax=Rhodocytophaga rosea TaxID=2704465 RepID=A0A6C0GD48_9BACT|nr:DUF2851 family protein [Rhodocytophaga rosea]QHT65906.1 DUF2851 family protein [Rhodocytophaga rosea]
MQEDFLHFIWQFQYFNRQQLLTTASESLHILNPGLANDHAGPDFSQARIRIGNIEWAGQVEIHIKSSDWEAHQHQHDLAYENVILHVVWHNDKPICRKDGSLIPTLELKERVNVQLLGRYNYLLANKNVIPCASLFALVPDIHKVHALDKALMQRLQYKAATVQELLAVNGQDWEETTYQWLARSMGFKLNAEPFLQLAKAIPLKLLQKHRDNLLQMEALLFGQAGFLEEQSNDAYVQSLQKEYKFLSHKYQLAGTKLSVGQWKFAKLRPVNFPTLRIAHLAALLQVHQNLFSLFIHTDTLHAFADILAAPPSSYWQHHYTFEKETKITSHLGKESISNLVINTVVPILACYAQQKDKYAYIDTAIAWLESLPAEDNYITRLWKELQLPVKNAFDAQASIELYNIFCVPVKCLSCPVGVHLIKKSQ